MTAAALAPAPTAADAGQGTRRAILVALVFVAIMLNYVDRQIIALLKPTLQAEFSWSDRDYARMASAFQISAAVAFLFVGLFLDRVGLRRGFAVGVGGWSLAAIAHTFATTVGSFVAVRALLGAFEATGTPAAVKTAATYFPARQRSQVLGLGNMAPNVGAVIAPLAVPPLALVIGWRATFIIAGGLGLVWVVAWLIARMPAEQPQPPAPPREKGAVLRQLRERRQWAVILAKALTDQVWWFLLFFLPDFFNKVFGMGQAALGGPVALVYVFAGLGALSGGFLPGRLLARGMSLNAARKRSLLLYALLILPVPLVLQVDSPWAAACVLGVALFAHQGFSTNVFAFTTDVFPARVIGLAIGIAAFAGNLSGMAMIEFAGWALDTGRGYAPMLLIASVSYLLALAAIQLLVPRIEPQDASAGDGTDVRLALH